MAPSTAPSLVRRPANPRRPPRWDARAERVLEHPGGPLRVLGGPGTGKTTLLAAVAADRVLRAGVDPENVLVLTANRRAAVAMRSRITALLTGQGPTRTAREPLVRTVHSYAFAVLRLQSARDGLPPPRLLAGPDQDAVVRDLLAGDIELGADYWPPRIRPALPLPGFAAELRDLVLRAAERGMGPEDLIRFGREQEHPEWVAAGTFWQQYEQVTLLAGAEAQEAAAPAMDAAELVAQALLAFDVDRGLLAEEQARVRHLLVDDAQHLDHQQHRLIRALGASAAEMIVAGDPDQAVFSFRGADPTLFTEHGDGPVQTLALDRRMAPEVRKAVQRLSGRLPGTGPQRELLGPEQEQRGSVQVRLLATAAQEATWIADQLRRAHLLDEVPWSEMAVLVRSTAHSLPVLRRALLAAGVPLAVPVDELPLAQLPAVRQFLVLLRCAADPSSVDPETAAFLLESQLGGADALALRRLRRGLRRLELAAGGERSSGELLVEVLLSNDALAALEDAEAAPVRRVARLLRTATRAVRAGQGLEQVLWQLWQDSGLQDRWLALSGRGGQTGAQADRDLDAIVGVFDAAARYVDRLPGASISGFADYLAAQQIVGDSLAPTAPLGEAVEVLTAHAATGREWTVVAVPGVQEGSWPNLRSRGTLLGVERMTDLLSGVAPEDVVSATAPLLAEERRLLLVAVSRAKRTLLVSAVRGEDEQPSRFLDELDGTATDPDAAARPVFTPPRGLVLAELVGELRRVVCQDEEPLDRRQRAAAQLARLAAAGVPGAHPDSWYGLAPVSTTSPLWTDGELITVSPSTIEVLTKCPLRWMVERHGGEDPAQLASITGTLVHALAQAAATGADLAQVREKLEQAWASVDAGAPWFSRKERVRVERMLDTFMAWFDRSRTELTQVAVEQDLSVDVPPQPGGPWLRVRGRVDRLEVDAEGRPVVVDIKTGKTPVTKNEAEQHPQLAIYQLATQLGAFEKLGVAEDPGGARLLYVAKQDKTSGAAERGQQALDEEGSKVWLDVVQKAAASCVGPDYTATESSDCPRCPARPCCPLHESGRQLGE
ncbi:ATP-dependent DNA helicase [Kutzneria viridogrisea]|uniref:DNA 3'-5' helicase n=1 Tax=Kutzneria viridogrisea TaxID=47990 RepID=A0ABR6BT35_9PSEU|nr:ATP-dependent DNA helicase [Kutzneria albida]MBA8930061.1 superfamily I DNA/RNA helicase/RecB family exonuclease [Kutzneria viridogrisea]